MTKSRPELDRLAQLARRTALLARINDVASRAALLSLFPLLYAAVGICLIKVLHAPPSLVHGLAWGALVPGLIFLGGVLNAALRHEPEARGALALDRHHGLHDRVTSALAFAALPEARRTPLMDAAIEDAVAALPGLSPRAAVPLRAPRDLAPALALLVATLGLAALEVPITKVLPPPQKAVESFALAPDDVELFRKMGSDLETKTDDPTTLASARRFNQLVEDLAEHRLDKREVFRKLDELERGLQDPMSLDTSGLDEALDGIAKELDKAVLSKPVAQALAEKRLADAEQAMKDLADKVEKAKKDVDKNKLEQLREALKKAGEKTVKHDEAKKNEAEKEHQSLEERRKKLLQKKQKEELTPDEQKELDRTERRLEKLDREKAERGGQGDKSSGLDKDLAKAASDLAKDLGLTSQDLKSAAEDINRAGRQKQTEQQKQEMKRRIEEMRQILRQEGQAGRERLKRMLQFSQSAHGQQGQQGQGKQGQGQGQGQQGQGKNGQGQGQGQQGGEGKGEKQLTLHPGGSGSGDGVLLQPGQSMASSGQSGQSGGEEPGGGGESGDEAGTGHDPNLRGDASRLKGQVNDVTAAAADTGQGAASSTVIYGAAERGFVGRGYKKVFTDYQNVAEESLAKDDIPSGYRFYVRRYFQLIRPRD